MATPLQQSRGRATLAGLVAIAICSLLLHAAPADANRAAVGICPAWVASSPKPAGPKSADPPAATVEPGGLAVGPTRASIEIQLKSGKSSQVVVQYGRSTHYAGCSPVMASTSTPGKTVLLKRLQPDSTYHFRVVARSAAGPSFGAARSFHTLPGGDVPQGVKVGTVAIGGMPRDQALAVLERPLATPLRLSYAGAYWRISRAEAGATMDARAALTAALTASPGAALPPLKITLDTARLRAYVAGLGKRWSHKDQTASVRLDGKHAVVTKTQGGVVVDTKKMTALIAGAVTSGDHGLIPLAVVREPASALPAVAQRAVVIRLGAQTLTAYLNGKPVLETPVTTGRPALPTPIGSYTIHYRASPYTFVSPWPQGSPYWYPPTSVTWAMYFFDNDFLHDDPAEPDGSYGAGSEYGYYASHGCVHVPHSAMAFLYNWLPVGATVIVSQT
jgi:lipoprotein-anchoring transpeptidase ErfK/SrfK